MRSEGGSGQVLRTWTRVFSPEGSFFFVLKLSGPEQFLRNWSLTLERRDGHGQHEGVPQRVHWLEDGHVLDQRLVPQETEEQSHNDNVNSENNGIVQNLLLVTGLQKIEHLFISNAEKKFLIVR